MSSEMTPTEDMKAARATYTSFIGTLKWAVPVIAVITLLVVLLIS